MCPVTLVLVESNDASGAATITVVREARLVETPATDKSVLALGVVTDLDPANIVRFTTVAMDAVRSVPAR